MRLLTVTEAAAATGLQERLIRRLCASGHLSVKLIGKTYAIPESELAKLETRPRPGRRYPAK